jgi:curved DNA-binding protein CbpA
MANYYQILDIPQNAGQEQIRQAFKRMAKRYHPDVNRRDPKAEELFKLVNEAYQVLSDSNKRFFYDQRLSGINESNEHGQATHTYATRPRNAQPKRSYYQRYRAETFSPEEEKLSNIYAFSFVGIVAVIVLTIMGIYEFTEKQKLKRLISSYNEQLDKAKILFSNNKPDEYLELILQLKQDFAKNSKIKNLEYELGSLADLKGNKFYQQQVFDSALYYMLYVFAYQPMQQPDFYYKLARCYRFTGSPHRAILILDDLQLRDQWNVQYVQEMGHIHLNQLQDEEGALEFYQRANKLIFSKMINTYGEAYRLLVSRERTPSYYFDSFYGAGKLLFAQNDYLNSAKQLEWAVFMQPNHRESLRMLTIAYQQTEQWQLACKYNQRLISLDEKPILSVAECKNYSLY